MYAILDPNSTGIIPAVKELVADLPLVVYPSLLTVFRASLVLENGFPHVISYDQSFYNQVRRSNISGILHPAGARYTSGFWTIAELD